MKDPQTREQWLNEFVSELRRSVFRELSLRLPDEIEVSCGWPSSGGLRNKKKTIGECWYPEHTTDGRTEIFISPWVEDKLEVGAILVHELCHAALGIGKGHKGDFKRLAREAGLEGKATATYAGDDLKTVLAGILERLPEYPHASLGRMKTDRKKQGTRLVKAVCARDGYTVRVTRKWMDVGMPVCPCGEKMEEQEAGE